ncbi:MAG: VanZ family protein [Asticcacaulis sp.]|nr:VanZ family protein [Asticcacaulis sp.]
MVWMIRCCLAVLAITVGVLVFGPFSGAEEQFGLTDKEAHAAAFFALTIAALMGLPRLRKWDVALIIVTLGALVEVVQTIVGRDGNVPDWLADTLGVALAVVPMQLETVRFRLRGGRIRNAPRRRRTDRGTASAPVASRVDAG